MKIYQFFSFNKFGFRIILTLSSFVKSINPLYFDILPTKNCTIIDRKKCVLHLSGGGGCTRAGSIWMAGVKVQSLK